MLWYICDSASILDPCNLAAKSAWHSLERGEGSQGCGKRWPIACVPLKSGRMQVFNSRITKNELQTSKYIHVAHYEK